MQITAKEIECEMTLLGNRLFIKGEYGEHWAYHDQPAQIGLAVLQSCLGEKLSPPQPWKGRKEDGAE
jgi:hypothetical protein